MNTSRRFAPWMVPLTAILLGTPVHKAFAQEQPPAPAQPAAAVPTGTRFLVRLEDELNTAKVQKNKRFKVHTLEPLEAGNGITIPTGAEIRGHVSGVEPGGLTGRARLWLTFDEIHAPSGTLPIIAEVAGVPGEHSVKQGDAKEGEIEARTSKGRREAESAAAGAAIGAAAGAKHGGGKGAAIGAAAGAAAGFLVSSGLGQELDLPKGTKLELELVRPLYLPTK
jgi:YmgG-like glycine-zipper protein